MITYCTGNLFNAPPGSILVHSCNAQGVWGAGVALQMKNRYWEVYQDFRKWLQMFVGSQGNPLGSTRLLDRHSTSHSVASMVVSNGFGNSVDPPEVILGHTATAVCHLLTQEVEAAAKESRPLREFHSPRINAGLFDVPWEQTETIILAAFNRCPFRWTVWTP